MKDLALMLDQSNQNKKTGKKVTFGESSDERSRIYQRQFKNFRFQRRVLIPLRDLSTLSFEKDPRKAKSGSEEDNIYNQ